MSTPASFAKKSRPIMYGRGREWLIYEPSTNVVENQVAKSA
jgi:hypothetical protein